jgi:small subunit ribosomal protein S10
MSAALKKTEKEVTAKLRIKLRAYDHKVIDKSAQQIIDMAVRCGVKIAGPIPLPIEINKFTVNRSTFVHKSAREQFEMRIHKRVIDILNPNQKVVESLKSLTLPAGVDTEIKSIM